MPNLDLVPDNDPRLVAFVEAARAARNGDSEWLDSDGVFSVNAESTSDDDTVTVVLTVRRAQRPHLRLVHSQ